jgi:hypothetical protein
MSDAVAPCEHEPSLAHAAASIMVVQQFAAEPSFVPAITVAARAGSGLDIIGGQPVVRLLPVLRSAS